MGGRIRAIARAILSWAVGNLLWSGAIAAWAFGGSTVVAAIAGILITAFAEVGTPLLTLLMVGIFLMFLPVMGTLGHRLSIGQAVVASGTRQRPSGAKQPKYADLSIIAMHNEARATFRVENRGVQANVAFTMLRIEDPLDEPYRMRWEPTNRESLAVPVAPEKGQVVLDIGEIRSVEVARLTPKTAKEAAHCVFPWPGGWNINYEVEDEDWLALEMEVLAHPRLKEGWHKHYALEFDDDYSKITGFYEYDPTQSAADTAESQPPPTS